MARAAEHPLFTVNVESVQTLYTATPASSSVPGFKPHINFPWMTLRADGSFLVWWTVGQTHGVGNFGLASIGTDNGQTWTAPSTTIPFAPPIALIKPPGQTSRGFSINAYSETPYTTFNGGRHLSTDGGLNWAHSTVPFDCAGVQYISMYQNPGTIVEDGNTLLINAFGQRPGVATFELVLFASTDGGSSWTRRATVAAHTTDVSLGPMGEEGPNESDIVMLNSGILLAVLRTGQPFPNASITSTAPSIFWTMSEDHGFTWTPAKSLGTMGAYPHLNRLPDGSIAMTYGRYGAQLMFADPTGRRWSRPTVLLNESSSGYVRMQPTSNGKFVYIHDHSSFYPPSWDCCPPAGYVYANDLMSHMKAVTLTISTQAATDDYDWMVDYHGDELPNTLPVPWTLSASGSVKSYRWADLGQDYLHLDTGPNGVNRSLYYTLQGTTGSPWAPLNFNKGVVLDLRARVASAATSESAAGVTLGDGANGYLSLELTGSCVNLEGVNGNLGQVTYCAAGHPGFLTTDWHNYRLTIAPDPAAGNQIRAKLYLDGNYAAPILTQSLNLAVNFDEIRFGDQTGNNNGVWDVDFLRFASLGPVYVGDFDGDDDVDMKDFGYLQACLTGPLPQTDPTCAAARLDANASVNETDVSIFLDCLSGADLTPPNPACVR